MTLIIKTINDITSKSSLETGVAEEAYMPQYQQQKKGMARIKVLSKDATRAYMLLMQKTGGKMQALPGNVFVIDEALLEFLKANNIEYEGMAEK